MSQANTQSVPRSKFLTMAANLLHRALLDVPRTQAKSVFKELGAGKAFHLATVKMEDQSTVRFRLLLDASEYRGKLTFGSFRSSLALLVSNLGRALEEQLEFQVFTQEGDPNSMIFGVTAVTKGDNEVNVMVLGADTHEGEPAVTLRLMYIDDSQFAEAGTSAQRSS